MSEEKKMPTHRLKFSEIQHDQRGQEVVGRPMEVATIWPRKEKSNGILEWHIEPQNLPKGVWFVDEVKRERGRDEPAKDSKDGFEQAEQQSRSQDQERER